jgi:hypothetical protein
MARFPRTSECLRHKDARTLEKGFDHACRLGLQPNLFITINWHWTDFSDSDDQGRALWRFLERLRKWFSRRALAVVWLYVRERSNDSTSEHVHLLLHCPSLVETHLRAAAPNWAEANDPRAMRIDCCWKGVKVRGREYNVRTLVSGYMLKGGDAAVLQAFPAANSRNWSHEQGTILGKRAGVSAAIGPKALAEYFTRRNLSEPTLPPVAPGPLQGAEEFAPVIETNGGADQAAVDYEFFWPPELLDPMHWRW